MKPHQDLRHQYSHVLHLKKLQFTSSSGPAWLPYEAFKKRVTAQLTANSLQHPGRRPAVQAPEGRRNCKLPTAACTGRHSNSWAQRATLLPSNGPSPKPSTRETELWGRAEPPISHRTSGEHPAPQAGCPLPSQPLGARLVLVLPGGHTGGEGGLPAWVWSHGGRWAQGRTLESTVMTLRTGTCRRGSGVARKWGPPLRGPSLSQDPRSEGWRKECYVISVLVLPLTREPRDCHLGPPHLGSLPTKGNFSPGF